MTKPSLLLPESTGHIKDSSAKNQNVRIMSSSFYSVWNLIFIGRDDDKLSNAWSSLSEILTDEEKSLPIGEFFLERGGIKLLLKCKKKFPLYTALGEEMITTLYQISCTKELRPLLMSKKEGDKLLAMILEFIEADFYSDANHYASRTLANLLSDGKSSWLIKSLSYNYVCQKLDTVPDKLDTNVKFEMEYDTFKTILPLLESPECQYFALWALKVHTTKSCCKYT